VRERRDHWYNQGARMKALFIVGLALLAGACSSDDKDQPIECSQSDRAGLYLVRYGVLEGCTEYEGAWIEYNMALPGNCEWDAVDQWSNHDCTLERYYTCTDTPSDVVTAWVGSTTQLDEEGKDLTGSASLRTTRLDGTFVCMGILPFDVFL
jgi:hypothetical protein